ncbi:hypothetical protein CLIB1423_18S00408 [[Candida] railenensis]|uniref:Histone H1 n=1 Tax=[Candida] railenensis TaxID=45579 RepID=A0A9P0QTU1_9ASCO|nr:hypothetical protein CLIB1423_18S00408 [[Candida] railenensis]
MSTKTKTSDASKLTYKDMIKTAIVTLKERNGSSRQALKKYVQSNYDIKAANFDSLFNTALRKGVEVGDFLQPKGPSGPVKVAKKEKAAPKVAKVTKPKVAKPKAAKVTKPKVAKAPKKEATKKTTTKKAAPKKDAKKAAPKKETKKAAPKKVTKKTEKKAKK